MKKAASLVLMSVVAAASFVVGKHFSHVDISAKAGASPRHLLYYACPMHPTLRSSHPGDCMACGMKLEPVYNSPAAPAAATSLAAHSHMPALPAGAIHVNPDRLQLLGVKTAAVRQTSRSQTLRTTGRVAVDEAGNCRIVSGMEGRVMQVAPGATGDIVKKGQLLAVTSYLPNFLIAQQTFISALNTADSYREAEARAAAEAKAAEAKAAADAKAAEARAMAEAKNAVASGAQPMPAGPAASDAPSGMPMLRRPGGAPGGTAPGKWRMPPQVAQSAFSDYIRSGAQVRTTRETLMTMGMGAEQVEEIERTRQIVNNIELRAPEDSVILSRSIYPQQKFDKGAEFYRLADLRHVWILADLNAEEGRLFRPGQRVKVSLPNQSKSFLARVSGAVPQFDEASRVLRVRLEADNPGYRLKPGMFVDVNVPQWTSWTTVVPVDAVVDSGLTKTVYVDHGKGVFEPRRVETGLRWGDQVQIKRGLKRGERIVVSGNFLLDSESRMRQTAVQNQEPPHHHSRRRM